MGNSHAPNRVVVTPAAEEAGIAHAYCVRPSISAGCRLAVGVGLVWEGSPGSAGLGTHGGIELHLGARGLELWLRVQHHLRVLDGGCRAGNPALRRPQLQAGVAHPLFCSL